MTQSFDDWWKGFSGDKYLPENQFIGIAYNAGAASRQTEIDKLEMEIKETQAFLNNQNHIKQTRIDELQKRIDDALKELEFIHSNKTQNSNNAINILKGNRDD